MITTKKLVLVTNYEEDTAEFRKEFNYEAIRIISEETQIEYTWHCNKTPLMLMKHVTSSIRENYSVLELPEFIFGHEDFIHFCHSHGFECGEYISGTKFNTAKDRCFLCSIADHMEMGSTQLFNQMVKNEHDMIIYESENFFVKIELGCMKKGMLMICPKMHVLSAANIPDEFMDEYLQIMRDVEFILKGTYGDKPVIFFEHGSAPSGFSSHERSIVHAHTHVAWGVSFPQKYLDMVCLKPVSDIRVSKDSKYLSYQKGTKGPVLLVNDPEIYIQRQYPRQVIGELIGIPNELTNWRKEAFTKNMSETFSDIWRFLSESQGFLSERIASATDGFVKGYPLR